MLHLEVEELQVRIPIFQLAYYKGMLHTLLICHFGISVQHTVEHVYFICASMLLVSSYFVVVTSK